MLRAAQTVVDSCFKYVRTYRQFGGSPVRTYSYAIQFVRGLWVMCYAPLLKDLATVVLALRTVYLYSSGPYGDANQGFVRNHTYYWCVSMYPMHRSASMQEQALCSSVQHSPVHFRRCCFGPWHILLWDHPRAAVIANRKHFYQYLNNGAFCSCLSGSPASLVATRNNIDR